MSSRETTVNLVLIFSLFIGVVASCYYAYKTCDKQERADVEYQFIIIEDSIKVYDGDRTVGTVKLEGQLDSLLIIDNE